MRVFPLVLFTLIQFTGITQVDINVSTILDIADTIHFDQGNAFKVNLRKNMHRRIFNHRSACIGQNYFRSDTIISGYKFIFLKKKDDPTNIGVWIKSSTGFIVLKRSYNECKIYLFDLKSMTEWYKISNSEIRDLRAEKVFYLKDNNADALTVNDLFDLLVKGKIPGSIRLLETRKDINQLE